MAATTFDNLFTFNTNIIEDSYNEILEKLAETDISRYWLSDPRLKSTSNSEIIVSNDKTFGKSKVQTSETANPIIDDIPTSTQEFSFYDHLQQKVFTKLFFPPHWADEGVKKPNIGAKKNAFMLCMKLYKKYNIEPDRILSTKEEGVYIVYDSVDLHGNKSMIIESYNDGEIGLIISDNEKKEIVYNEDISEMDFENAVRIYKAKTR